MSEGLAAPIPDARLVLVDGAGHPPTLERPHATTLAPRDGLGH